jgi:hypothetical protein
MADAGIGIGIGRGLGEIGEALSRKWQLQYENRENQVTALHQRGQQIAANIKAQRGALEQDPNTKQWTLKVPDQNGNMVPYDPAKNPDLHTQFQEMISIPEKMRALYPDHETPKLVQHLQKLLGKTPGAPQPDPRASQFTPGTFMSETPGQPQYSGESESFIQLSRLAADPSQPLESRQAAAQKLLELRTPKTDLSAQWQPTQQKPFVVSPEDAAATARRPGVYEELSRTKDGRYETATRLAQGIPAEAIEKPKKPLQQKMVSGVLESIVDPNTSLTWHAGNIDQAPEEVQQLWNAQKQSEATAQARKDAATDKRYQESRDRQTRSLAAAAERQRISIANAYDRKDYDTATKEKVKIDDDYQFAIDRATAMDQSLQAALNNGDQQAMLNLLLNHVRMTQEGNKNAPRMTQAMITEAQNSAPWLDRMISRWGADGYLEGVTLTPDQMRQMVQLAHEKVDILKQHKQRTETDYPLLRPSAGDLKNKAKPTGGLTPEQQKLKEELEQLK